MLAIPPKRFDWAVITYLTEPESPQCWAPATCPGSGDVVTPCSLAVHAGLRISEITGLTRADTHIGSSAHVACHGNGRKEIG